MDSEVIDAIQDATKENKIICDAANKIAEKYNKPSIDIGAQLDQLKIKIIKCQLGLFGYQPETKRITSNKNIDSAIQQKIENAQKDGRISCKTCWEIADQSEMSRLEIANACEGLNIKISACQLGAF